MNILDAILSAQGGPAVRETGQTVGLSQEQTQAALSALVPALAAGVHRTATHWSGVDASNPDLCLLIGSELLAEPFRRERHLT